MADDVLLNKAAQIERALARAREEYVGHEALLETDLTRQDAIVLNLQRACQSAIDGAMRLVRRSGLGLPQDSRDAFIQLTAEGLLDEETRASLVAMVGFRNVAIHEYQRLSIPVVRHVLEERLSDLERFAEVLIEHGSVE